MRRPMGDPGVVAAFLIGWATGVLSVPFAAGVYLWWSELRAAVREGTPIEGEGLERAKRRGELP